MVGAVRSGGVLMYTHLEKAHRERDIWPMIRQAWLSGDGPQARVILEDGQPNKLPKHMAKQPVVAEKIIDIEACGGRRERKARRVHLAVWTCTVLLKPPAPECGGSTPHPDAGCECG